MLKKKSSKKPIVKKSKQKRKPTIVDLHMYGIFDKNRKVITKISLDHSEIQMEIALSGGLASHLAECEFKIKLSM